MVRLPAIRRLRRRVFLMVALVAPAAFVAATARAGETGSGRLMERLFQKMDSDGDGVLSAAEGEAAAEKMFERRDSDDDGILAKGEFLALPTAGRLSADQRQKLQAFQARRFATCDRNGDGQVTAEEFFAAAQQRFLAADGNHDGRVTQDEMRSLRDAL